MSDLDGCFKTVVNVAPIPVIAGATATGYDMVDVLIEELHLGVELFLLQNPRQVDAEEREAIFIASTLPRST